MFFDRRFDRRVWVTVAVLVACGAVGTPLTLYVAWQDNIRVGYAPEQPIPFSHQLHAGSLQIECMYCHTGAEKTAHATVPSVDVCMNCHSVFAGDETKPDQVAKIAMLRSHAEDQAPIAWEKVYDLADFAHFHHGRHIQSGLECRQCHGAVESMAVVEKLAPLTMGWCLKCHMGRTAPMFNEESLINKTAAEIVDDPIYREILAPINCSTCHR